LEIIGDFAQMQGGASKSIKPGDNETIPLPYIFQTSLQPETLSRRTAFLLSKNYVTKSKKF
jgi:hypothetical protein